MKILLTASTSLILLSSCATMQTGNTQDIKISSTPSGATCNYDNTYRSGQITTDSQITLDRSKKTLNVNCVLPGYGTGSTSEEPFVNWWLAANILNFGIGYFYDVYNGASWDYDDEVNVVINRDPRINNTGQVNNGYQLEKMTAVATPQVEQYNLGQPTMTQQALDLQNQIQMQMMMMQKQQNDSYNSYNAKNISLNSNKVKVEPSYNNTEYNAIDKSVVNYNPSADQRPANYYNYFGN